MELAPHLSVRTSADYVVPNAYILTGSLSDLNPVRVQHNVRVSAGLVYSFGGNAAENLVEPFTVENGRLTRDFPAGEEANLRLSAIAALRASGIFEKVDDGSQTRSEEPPSSEQPGAKEGQRKVILSGTVIAFKPGSSGARYLTWPLPVGVTKARARFVLRDAASNQEVFRFEKEARFQAAGTFGIATKEGQMSHMKGGLVDALVKEIERNR